MKHGVGTQRFASADSSGSVVGAHGQTMFCCTSLPEMSLITNGGARRPASWMCLHSSLAHHELWARRYCVSVKPCLTVTSPRVGCQNFGRFCQGASIWPQVGLPRVP